ncbi:hypothetical protein [Phenylobacterium sp.]|uniref:hypothetical protein n=1 Tax=Phenylobacterium sp. TaxID=1871053 RepID=UPI0035AED728
MSRGIALAAALALAGCGEPSAEPPRAETPEAQLPAPVAAASRPDAPVTPPEPGTPGGLPDDRTPVSEAPFTPQSAQGAGQVVQTYFALIGTKKYAEAFRLWSDGGRASGQDEAGFVRAMAAYPQHDAQIGAPGEIEGAAGSLYVEIPVVIYGRNPDGSEFHRSGKAVLRRVNDVPGSTHEQRQWRIVRFDLEP